MVEKAPWGGTELDQWVVPMNEGDAAFTALDVERQVTFSVDGGALTKVWQVDDDLDLGDLATDLEGSGFEAEEAGGATTFTADLGLADPTTQLVDGKYPVVSFREVTVVPDEHLVVAGPADAVLAVLGGDQESLADAGSVDAVTGSLGDAELLSLTTGDGVRCAPAQVRPADLDGLRARCPRDPGAGGVRDHRRGLGRGERHRHLRVRGRRGARGDGGLLVQRRRRPGPAHAAQPGRGLGLQPGLTLPSARAA